MQTIQYMGSKGNLLDFIENSINYYFSNIVEDKSIHVFFDAFCGSGRVANHFKNRFQVITNDKQVFTKVICDTYLCNTTPISFYEPYVAKLNAIKSSDYEHNRQNGFVDGFFVDNYSTDYNNGSAVAPDGNQKIWLTDNAKIIEMARSQIDKWEYDGELNGVQKNVLLFTLMLAVNKVSNVVGHQNGYLKKWCQNAQREIKFILPDIDVYSQFNHINMVGNIFDNIHHVNSDISYFDPPYGTNNKALGVATKYSSFYHLWNTLIENSRPEIFGKAGKPLHTKGYTEPLEKNLKQYVIPKFIRLIEDSRSRYVMFSYSNKSLLTIPDFRFVFEQAGCDMDTFRLFITPHKSNNQNVLAKKEGTYIERDNEKEELIEYLFIAKKKPYHARITKPDDVNIDIEDISVVTDYIEKDTSTYEIPDANYIINMTPDLN